MKSIKKSVKGEIDDYEGLALDLMRMIKEWMKEGYQWEKEGDRLLFKVEKFLKKVNDTKS